MRLKSSAFEDTQLIPPKYAKAGENVSPPLSWENIPDGTKSFALSIVDHHPVAKNFVHWLVVDIGADVTALLESASAQVMPAGSKELKAYTGPNPPSGSHDYELTLYALKTASLDLPKKVSLNIFKDVVEQNTLATAKLIGKFTKIKTGN
ncbi:MAG: YbhB/YbcL family Raf kinase inhibitor-like protein [Chloroflexota bacterium]